jgi:hypothetical protein
MDNQTDVFKPLEIGTDEKFIITRKLLFHGKPVEELSKQECLKAVQEVAFVALQVGKTAEKNRQAALSWKEAAEKRVAARNKIIAEYKQFIEEIIERSWR